MSNRTYRYFNGKPLFAFGHGLSYTKFRYADAKLNGKAFEDDDTLRLSFTVKNAGKMDGDEVAQVYFRHVKSAVPQPKMALCGFARVRVARGGTETVALDIPPQRFRYWDVKQKKYVVEAGKYELLVGGASDDIRLKVPFAITTD
jgi:beta-glucosidase